MPQLTALRELLGHGTLPGGTEVEFSRLPTLRWSNSWRDQGSWGSWDTVTERKELYRERTEGLP